MRSFYWIWMSTLALPRTELPPHRIKYT